MSAKRMKDLVREVESLGYAYDRTNAKGSDFFIHEDTGVELRLPQAPTETAARKCLTWARHAIGLPTRDNKRNPAQIRERNAAEHAKAKAELERLAAQRELYATSEDRLRQIEDEYLRAERKFRYWDRLMRQAVSA